MSVRDGAVGGGLGWVVRQGMDVIAFAVELLSQVSQIRKIEQIIDQFRSLVRCA
ncbi:hypothetical protein [Streptomyces acidiscabies]|uniref:hypothetical protein n=1 Tax=Streptomyces acidiscabies TaxID=42234 RepID=UPI00131D0669|nr:hypothetical protein [Streptomyces acidiscabies]